MCSESEGDGGGALVMSIFGPIVFFIVRSDFSAFCTATCYYMSSYRGDLIACARCRIQEIDFIYGK